MPFQRQTAKKVRIIDLTKGEWVKKEGMEPSFVVTAYGETVSRARLLATIVGKFISEDGNFGSITLDDSTDTMRAKTFKTVKPLEGMEPGEIVDIIGKVREYNEEIYLIPEIIRKVENSNLEILRKLEILEKRKNWKKPEKQEIRAGKKSEGEEKDLLRKEILKILEASEEAVAFTELISKVKAREEIMEKVVDEILSEGICYEPTPGKIKKI